MKVSRDGGWSYATCAIHTLQLAVGRALGAQRAVIDALAVARKLVGHFRHSAKATAVLEKLQRERNPEEQPLKVVQDVPTRWNSSFYMIQRLLLLRPYIREYARTSSAALTQPSSNQWDLLDALVSILTHAEEITKDMSRADACISQVS